MNRLIGRRYEVRREIGRGGHGIVYEAFDRNHERVVALKLLSEPDAASVYALKREFRSLRDVAHPNLVQLYELHSEDDACFFTMELVDGAPFNGSVSSAHADGGTITLPIEAPAAPTAALRDLLRQLADGIAFLHSAGITHRDLKPSNVLVTKSGRVVILDFGVAERGEISAATRPRAIVGTPAYMAPEQASEGSVSARADWYAFGVMLYQALTGRLPYSGSATSILEAKLAYDPVPPSTIVRDVPKDLEALCVALLARDGAARPAAHEVLTRLGGTTATTTAREAPFVGRTRELSVLRDAYRSSRTGMRTVAIRGASGVGKTALVREFLGEIADERPAPVILTGRCYEREDVPYKAFDGAVDSLTHALLRWSNEEIALVLPREASALARVFPVLDRVPAIAEAPRRPIADPQQLRLRAFAALREMFARIGDRRPLVLFIDDAQWHDADSTVLAAELAAPPDAPAFLLILGLRADAASDLETRLGNPPVIELSVLSTEDARSLARAMVPQGDETLAARIAEESAGNPFFLGELARASRRRGSPVRLAEVLEERLSGLDSPARAVLALVAVAQRLSVEAAIRASGLSPDAAYRAVATLRARQFCRSVPRGPGEALEPYHDRIRGAVLAQVDAEALREAHAHIGRALVATGEDDPETLFRHFHAAGIDDRALPYARAAAERATRALAFDRAAGLHRLALERIVDGASAHPIRVALGDALAHAGRGREAADVYTRAASDADPAEALRLRVRAAEQLLISGYIDRGLAAVEDVLAGVGMRLSPTPLGALIGLLFIRLWLRVRGLSFQRRDASSISPRALVKIDVCRSVGFGLAPVDNVRAVQFQSRHLALCLAVGEPHRVSRAIAIEATMRATRGVSDARGTARLTASAEALARELGTAEAEAAMLIARSSMAYFSGRFRETREDSQRAIDILREKVTGMRWELDGLEFFQMCTLTYLGDLRALRERLPPLIREAEDRGDLYLATNLAVGDTNLYHLLLDRPEDARLTIDRAIGGWSRRSFHLQHAYAGCSGAVIDLYLGDARSALARVREVWKGMRRSFQTRIQFSRVRARFIEGRAALGCRELDTARHAARALLRERVEWATAFGHLVLAGTEREPEHLRRAIAAADGCGMSLLVAVARHRLGETVGGDEGARLLAEANAYFDREGVLARDRLLGAYLPT